MSIVLVAGVPIVRGIAVRRQDNGADPTKADLVVPGVRGQRAIGITLDNADPGRTVEVEEVAGAVLFGLAGAPFRQDELLVPGDGGRLVPAKKGELAVAIARGRATQRGQLIPVEIAQIGLRA